MPRLKGRRKSRQSILEQIGPALLPAAALTAVPFFHPGLQALEGRPLTLALNVFDTLALPPSPQTALGESSGEHGGASADPHDEDMDDEDMDMDMEEAGYTTVARATWPQADKRKSYSDRERVPTPPTDRNVATAGHVTQSGDVYHILEPDEADPVETDIYAVPVKGKGPGKTTMEKQAEEDPPLDHTQQEVRRAMLAIHETPVEETMMGLSEIRQANQSHLGSSSGRGTMWEADDEEDSDDEEPPPLPPPPVDNGPASEAEAAAQHASESEVTSDLVSEAKVTVRKVSVKQAPEAVTVPEPHTEVKQVMYPTSSPEVQSPRSAGSGSAAQSSQLSATPRDAPSLPLEAETKPAKEEPHNHHQDVVHHRKASAPGRNGVGGSGRGSSRRSATPREAPSLSLKREVKQVTQPRSTPREAPSQSLQNQVKQVTQPRSTPREAPALSLQNQVKQVTQPRSTPREAPVVSSQRQVGQVKWTNTTPREDLSVSLQREVEQVKRENQNLHQEVLSLRKMAVAVGSGGEEGSGRRARQSPVVEDLKSENEVLKNTVGRLNQELSQYQAAFRPLSEEDHSKLQGLPQKGPVPTWLINKRYLAPLFLAYDDLIEEKEGVIQRFHAELQTLKSRAEDVVRENQRYQLRGSHAGTGTMGAIHASDWQALQDQARLVLEENQILTEQVDLQHRKVTDLCSSHMHQVSRLTHKMTACEQEREEMERELEETRSKLKDVKHKHDKMQLEAVKQMTMHGHVHTVADIQRSVVDDREQFEQQKEQMLHKLMASDEERKHQTLVAIEAGAENKHLKAEVSAMHNAVRRSQNKLLLLQKAIRLSETKELVTQNELANVIKMVEKTALERDSAFRMAKEKQRDCKNTVDQIVGSTVVMGKMEEKLKMYKLKASAKLQTVSEKLKEQDDVFNRQRQEYEREISYLRSLLMEKEEKIELMKGEKRDAEESLETVWQAARLENQRLKDTLVDSVQKLRQHPGLHAALDEEENLERLLHFSA